MATLYLLQYKNYYNRQATSTTLADYKTHVVAAVNNTNFNYGDGVITSHTVNVGDTISFDYAVVTDINPASYQEVIKSRWYVTDRKSSRRGQCVITLRRDVVVDFDKELREANVYVSRGWVDGGNPLVFNSEGNSYNQIKTSEVLLKDKSNTAWIVAYLAQNFFGDTPADKKLAVTGQQNYDMTYGTLTDLWAAIPNSNTTSAYSFGAYLFTFDAYITDDARNSKWKVTDKNVTYDYTSDPDPADWTVTDVYSARAQLITYSPSLTIMSTDVKKDHPDALITNYSQLISTTGKIARIGSGENYQYYQLKTTAADDGAYTFTTNTGDEVRTTINKCIQNTINDGGISGSIGATQYDVVMTTRRISATWVDITEDVTLTLKATATRLRNAPYYMICMPYNAATIRYNGQTYTNVPY